MVSLLRTVLVCVPIFVFLLFVKSTLLINRIAYFYDCSLVFRASSSWKARVRILLYLNARVLILWNTDCRQHT